MKLNRQNQKPAIGLFRQLRRFLTAPREDSRRRQNVQVSDFAQPIEACEVRAMLSAAPVEFGNDLAAIDVLSDIELAQQISNAEAFAAELKSETNVLEVITLLDGAPIELHEFWSISSGPDAIDFSVVLEPPVDNGWKELPGPDVDFKPRPPIEAEAPSPEQGEWITDADLPDVALAGSDVEGASFGDTFASASFDPADEPDEQVDRAVTSLTTIVRTDAGIVVLHQTTAEGLPSANSSIVPDRVQQFVDGVVQQFRDEQNQKTDNHQSSNDRISAPAELEHLDSVFKDDDRLFHDLSAQSSEATAVIAAAEPVGQQPDSRKPLSEIVRVRPIAGSRSNAVILLMGLTSEFQSVTNDGYRLRHRANWTESANVIATTTARVLAEGRLVLQLFPALTFGDEDSNDAELLMEQAREAAQPVSTIPDLRDQELLNAQILLSNLDGEIWDTSPFAIPQPPHGISAIESSSISLLHSINPRGPPQSELPLGFSRHDVVLLQHNLLQHSIAPRSPSKVASTEVTF